MPKGYPKNGINSGRFQKGHKPVSGFHTGQPIPKRSVESYEAGAKKMVETRKAQGSYQWSDESKERASIAHKGKKQPWSSKNILALMESGRLYKERTSIERTMRYLLDTQNFPFIEQYKIKFDKWGTLVDFYIPTINAVIYCDGCYWHGCKKCYGDKRVEKRNRDEIINKTLEMHGYNVLRVYQHQYKDIRELRQVVRDFVLECNEYRDTKHMVPFKVQ